MDFGSEVVRNGKIVISLLLNDWQMEAVRKSPAQKIIHIFILLIFIKLKI